MAEEQVQPVDDSFELVQEGIPAEDEIITEQVPKPENLHVRSNDALDDAMYASGVGREPTLAYEETMTDIDYSEEDRGARTEKSLDRIFNMEMERIDGDIAADRLDPEATALKLGGISKLSQDMMAESKAYVMQNPSVDSFTEKEIDDAAFLHFVRLKANAVWGSSSKWDVAMDLGAMVFAPLENLRISEVADLIGAEFTAGDAIDTTEFLSALTDQVLTLGPEARVKLVDELIGDWPEILGDNKLALVDFLMKLSGDLSEDFSHLENALERTDQALIGASLLSKVGKGVTKTFGAMRLASKLKNLEAVADMVGEGAKGNLVGANISPLDAVSTLDPSDSIPILLKGSGASPETTAGVNKIEAQVRLFTNEVDKLSNPGLGLDKVDMDGAMQRAEINYEAMTGVSKVKVEPLDDLAFKLRYDEVDSNGVKISTQERIVSYTEKDLEGGFLSEGGVGHKELDLGITSPLFRFVADVDKLVRTPEILKTFKAGAIRKFYDGAVKQALKGLNKKSKRRVEGLVEEGTDFLNNDGVNIGKVFTRDDLVNVGVNGVKYTEAEYNSYKGMRAIADHLYWSKNTEILNDFNARGVKIVSWNGQKLPVKTYEDPKAAQAAFTQSDVISHHVAVGSGDGVKKVRKYSAPRDFSIEKMHEAYRDGFVLVKGDKGGLLSNGSSNTQWALVKRADASTPSGAILNRRIGYWPRVRKDAFYFVKEKILRNVGGSKVSTFKTTRYFDNKVDADIYRDQLNSGVPVEKQVYSTKADKEMTPSELEGEHLDISGGLFTGARQSKEIPFGLPGVKGKRVGALESLQRYINNVSSHMPTSVYRIGIQKRWLNHAKDLQALPPGYVGSFDQAVHDLARGNTSNAFLKDSHAQIKVISGVPTEAEVEVAAKFRALAEYLEKGLRGKLGGKFLARRVNNTSSEALAGNVRGIAFHMMLGMYNPAQILVQGSGALVALSISPRSALKAMPTSFAAGIVDMATGNPAKLRKLTKYMGETHGIKNFEEMYSAWRKSNMLEGSTHSSLDYTSIWNDAPYDAGIFRRAVGNGDVFYKSGELFNSRVSFFTAFNDWKRLNPGKPVTDSVVTELTKQAESFRLNMSKVNKSKFQTGILSIPTQFQKVNVAFAEKVVGGELDKATKIKLLGAQITMFGAAGVPFVTSLMPYGMDLLGINVENTPPEALNAVNRGLLGWVVQDFMDIDSLITGRMTLGTDFIDQIWGGATEGMIIADVAKGPFGNVWDKSWHIVDKFNTVFHTIQHGEEDLTLADYSAVTKILIRSLATLPSSTHQAVKASDMVMSKFYNNKHGQSMFEWEDKNPGLIAAQAFGFAPQQTTDWYELGTKGGGVNSEERIGDAKRLSWLLNEMEMLEGDATAQKWTGMAINAIAYKYGDDERLEITKELMTRLADPKETWEDRLMTALEEVERDVVEGFKAIVKHKKLRTNERLAKFLQDEEE